MNLDVLAIAAHPDDVELSCGGTMIKMAQLGYRTGILDLTRGEMGTRGTPETRAREAAAAAKVMKVKIRENLGLPDSGLEVSEPYKRKLAARIRALRPKTVILPYWEGRHPDHYNASKLGYEACWLAGLKALPLDGGDEAFRPFKIIYSTVYQEVRPSFVVDITAQIQPPQAGHPLLQIPIHPAQRRQALKSLPASRSARKRNESDRRLLWPHDRRQIRRAIPHPRNRPAR